MNYSYSNEEFIYAANKIYNLLIYNKKISDKKYAILTGGQPGSGKTTLHKIATESNPDIVIINGDEFRKFHPRYKDIINNEPDFVPFTQKFCNRMVEYLIDKLSVEGYSLLIEGTLRTTLVPLKTKTLLKEKGYSVELHVMAVPKNLSWQGTIIRYNDLLELGIDARKTSRESHDYVVEHIAENIDYLFLNGNFDNIKLFTRTKDCIYDAKKDKIMPGKILEQVLNNQCDINYEKAIKGKRCR